MKAARKKISEKRLHDKDLSLETMQEIDILEKETLAPIERDLQVAREEAQRELDRHIAESSMLRVLASTGTIITTFMHQHASILAGFHAVDRGLRRFGEALVAEQEQMLVQQDRKSVV